MDTEQDHGVNVDALRAIIPVLYELEAADRFFMDSWASGLVNPAAADWTDCGTQFCMAGAKAAVDGWRPQYAVRDVWHHGLRRSVRRPVATGFFVPPEHRHEDPGEDVRWAQSAERIARDAFGLNDAQTVFLFYATHITRVADLAARIEHVAAHPHDENPRDSFPGAQRAVEAEHAREDADRHARLARRADPDGLRYLSCYAGEFDEWIGETPQPVGVPEHRL